MKHFLSNCEKAILTEGKTAWETNEVNAIPSFLLTDGPHGVRKQTVLNTALPDVPSYPAVCFPTASISACSWDTELLAKEGNAIGDEARALAVDIVLGPGVNIKRSPLCGRNFEYFSEDPLLSGELASAYIGGLQSTGVQACIKHFAGNSREYFRAASNSIIDERTLHEIYLYAFETAIKQAKPGAIMPAYNMLNGEYCCENTRLLTDILRNEWGYDGLVVSDWGAVNDKAASLRAGLDLEMPGSSLRNYERVLAAIEDGSLEADVLDRAASSIERFAEGAAARRERSYTCDMDAHHALSRRVARESAVLLKNNGILPLAEDARFALIGGFAKSPRFQGGSGSAKIEPYYIDTPFDALNSEGREFAEGFDAETGTASAKQIEDAVNAAKRAGLAVVIAGLPETFEFEGGDRDNMCLPESMNALVSAVCEVVPTVVVLQGGSSMELPWADDTAAILYAGLSGETCGAALADVLFGRANPSGRLAETWAFSADDSPCARLFKNDVRNVEYREGVYVGYRFYAAAEKRVRYPFGYGLSYTSFEYSELKGNRDCVSLTVRNNGPCDGAEVVQIYSKCGLLQRLAGFKKVALAAGESTTLEISLDPRAFAFWDGCWTPVHGAEILACASALDIRLRMNADDPKATQTLPEQPLSADGKWSAEEFKTRFGSRFPAVAPEGEPFTLGSTLYAARGTRRGRTVRYFVRRVQQSSSPVKNASSVAAVERNMNELPLRVMCAFAGSKLKREAFDGIVLVLNGEVRKGIRLAISSIRSQRKETSLD